MSITGPLPTVGQPHRRHGRAGRKRGGWRTEHHREQVPQTLRFNACRLTLIVPPDGVSISAHSDFQSVSGRGNCRRHFLLSAEPPHAVTRLNVGPAPSASLACPEIERSRGLDRTLLQAFQKLQVASDESFLLRASPTFELPFTCQRKVTVRQCHRSAASDDERDRSSRRCRGSCPRTAGCRRTTRRRRWHRQSRASNGWIGSSSTRRGIAGSLRASYVANRAP